MADNPFGDLLDDAQDTAEDVQETAEEAVETGQEFVEETEQEARERGLIDDEQDQQDDEPTQVNTNEPPLTDDPLGGNQTEELLDDVEQAQPEDTEPQPEPEVEEPPTPDEVAEPDTSGDFDPGTVGSEQAEENVQDFITSDQEEAETEQQIQQAQEQLESDTLSNEQRAQLTREIDALRGEDTDPYSPFDPGTVGSEQAQEQIREFIQSGEAEATEEQREIDQLQEQFADPTLSNTERARLAQVIQSRGAEPDRQALQENLEADVEEQAQRPQEPQQTQTEVGVFTDTSRLSEGVDIEAETEQEYRQQLKEEFADRYSDATVEGITFDQSEIRLVESGDGLRPTLSNEGQRKINTAQREQVVETYESQIPGLDLGTSDVTQQRVAGRTQLVLTEEGEQQVQQARRQQFKEETVSNLTEQYPGLDLSREDVVVEQEGNRLTAELDQQAQAQVAAAQVRQGAVSSPGELLESARVGVIDPQESLQQLTLSQVDASDIDAEGIPTLEEGTQAELAAIQFGTDPENVEIADGEARLTREFLAERRQEQRETQTEQQQEGRPTPDISGLPNVEGQTPQELPDVERTGVRTQGRALQETQYSPYGEGGGGLAALATALGSDISGSVDQVTTDPTGAIFGPSGQTERVLGEGVSRATQPFALAAETTREEFVRPTGDVTADFLTAGGINLQLATPYTPAPQQDQQQAVRDVFRPEGEDVTEEGILAEDIGDVGEGAGEVVPMIIEGPETVRTLGALSSEGAAFTQRQIAEEGAIEGTQTTLSAGADVGATVGRAVAEQTQERPGFVAGTLIGTAGGIGLASRASGTAGRTAAFAVQPGEELASAGLTRAFPGVASRIPGGRIDVEEIAIGTTVAAGRGAARAGSRLRNLETGDIPTVEAPFRVEPTFEEGTGFFPAVEVESETAESALLRRGVEGARSRFETARQRVRDFERPQLTRTELDATGGELTTRRRLNIDRPDFETPQRIQSAIDEARLRYQRLRYDRPPQQEFAEPGSRTTVFAEEGEPTGLIQELGVQAETETETEIESGEFEGEVEGESTRVDVEQESGEQRTILQQEQRLETEQEEAIDTRRTGTGTDRIRGPAELPDQPEVGPEQAFDPIEGIGESVTQPTLEGTQPTFDSEVTSTPLSTGIAEPDIGTDLFTEQTQISQPTFDLGFEQTTTETITTPEAEFESELEQEAERRSELAFEFESRTERRGRFDLPFPDAEGREPFSPLFDESVERYEIDFLDPLTGNGNDR